MSQVGDAFSGGGTDTSGVNDQTFADATLGDQMQGGTGDFTGGNDASGGPTEFGQFSDVANALSSGSPVGSSPAMAQAASLAPPSAAGGTGGDPVGAAGGTQSATTPGSAPTSTNSSTGGQNQNQQQQNQYAPKSATDQLKALIKQLNTGKPPGPTGPVPQGGQNAPFALPTLAAGQTGPQSALRQFVGALPADASLEAGGTPPPAGTQPGGARDIPAADSIPGDDELKFDPQTRTYSLPSGGVSTDADGNPLTAAGTRADQTPPPPPRPGAQPTQTAAAGGGGRDITVQPKGGGMPAPQNEPGEVAPGGPALPTRKPTQPPAAAAPPQGAGATPRILQDISGASTGSPTALADLAQAARIILPLAGMLFGGGGRRGGRFGRFHGGRFTHGIGGFRGGHPGQFGHPSWRGAWPYHHPRFGWDMHHNHPGGGWLPMNPAEMQGLGGGEQGQGPNQQGGPNNPPQETEAGGQPDDTFQKSGFSANPFIDALVGQESGGGNNIVSRTDMDSQGRTLAQGGNPNEISQGYFQIQNHPGGTWDTYARQAGVDLNKYPTPRSAPLAVQWQVAQRIPIGQWGAQTKAILRQKFGQFDPNMPFGQVAAKFGPAGGRLAAAKPSRAEPAWAAGPTAAGLQLPVTSQPAVSASN
jgi:hypothetical protein